MLSLEGGPKCPSSRCYLSMEWGLANGENEASGERRVNALREMGLKALTWAK